MSVLREGIWGGRGVALRVRAEGAGVEFDCAHGEIEGGVELDGEGRFDVRGTFVPEGGPVSVPVEGVAAEKSFTARYRGRVEGDEMTLEVTVEETGGGPGTLKLVHGREPGLEKCY